MFNRKTFWRSAVSIWGLAQMSPATAQADPVATQESASAATQGSNTDFTDIIVTARKRQERLQDVPVAIAAYSSTDLQRYGTQSLVQLTAQTPQLIGGFSGNTTSGGNIVLRGVGSPATGPAVDQAVSIVVDGVQISKAYALRLGVYDIARAEVLKGPQALFYGKNSPGGVISLASADPGDALEGMVRAGYEFTARKKYVEATLSGPISENLGARLEGYLGDERGWQVNDAQPRGPLAIPAAFGGGFTAPNLGAQKGHLPGTRDIFLRGTLQYQPSDQFDTKLKVNYFRTKQNGGIGHSNQLIACVDGAPTFTVRLGAGSTDCKLDRRNNISDLPPEIAALDPAYQNGLFSKNRQILASLTSNYKFSDDVTLTAVTGYWGMKQKDVNNLSFSDQSYNMPASGISDTQFTQELRLATSFSSPFNFLVGGFYQHEKVKNSTRYATGSLLTSLFTGFTAPPRPALLINNSFSQKTDAWSVFGQALVDITSQVQITAGGRYSHERKQAAALSRPNFFSPVGYNVLFTPDTKSFSNFSPEATATYKPASNITLFAAYRYGFMSGGFDLGATTGAYGAQNIGDVTYDQEKAKGGEVGLKGTFVDRQILLDISAYSFKYTGLQVSVFQPATVSYAITNAGSARVKGVDFSLQYKPRQVSGLTLRSAVTYNDASYISFENSPCYPGQSQAAGCNLVVAAGTGGASTVRPVRAGEVGTAQNLSGRQLPRAPKWSLNLGGTFEQPLSGGMTLSFSTDGLYSSSYNAMAQEDPRALARKAWRLNARIALNGPDERWEFALIGTNLTQTLRPINALAHAATDFGTTGAVVGRLADLQSDFTDPRTVALQATYRF